MLPTNTLETQETKVKRNYKDVKLTKPKKVSPKLAQYFAELDENLRASARSDDEIGYSHEKVLRELGL